MISSLPGGMVALLLLAVMVMMVDGKVSHRFKTRQLVFTATPPHHLKTYCADLMCTTVRKKEKQTAHRTRLADWEGDSAYDLPYSFAYVIDVAIKGSGDSEFGEYSTIMDTGSSNLGIAEEACSACGGTSTSSLSVEYTDENCIEVVYGDSKEDSTYWEGYESVTVEAGFYTTDGASVTTETTFAAITDASSGSSSFFSGGYSGILGMAYSGISESYYDCETYKTTDSSTPLIDALYEAGQLDHDIFTIAFCGATAPLAIGDVDTTAYTGDIAYTTTQMTFGEYYGYYLIKVTDFEVGSESLSSTVDISTFNTYGGMLVDSGTTELILPTSIYTAFANKLMSSYGWLGDDFFSYESCLTTSGVSLLPDLTLELDGDVTLVLPASNYLIYYEGCYYWGVAASTMSILGNVAMQGLTVVFDRENTQIGFATASCSSSVGISSSATKSSTTTIKSSSSSVIRKAIIPNSNNNHRTITKKSSTTTTAAKDADKQKNKQDDGDRKKTVVVAGRVAANPTQQQHHDSSAITKDSDRPRIVHGKGPAVITSRYPEKKRLTMKANKRIVKASSSAHSRGGRYMWALAFMAGGLVLLAVATTTTIVVHRKSRHAYLPLSDKDDEFEM